jgi:hypothetical protein
MTRSPGKIIRPVSDSLAFLAIENEPRILHFEPVEMEAFWKSLPTSSDGLRYVPNELSVDVDWEPASGEILNLSKASVQHLDADNEWNFSSTRSANAGTEQLELNPDRPARNRIVLHRAIPDAARNFGKLVDTTALSPGDLLLTRELEPDAISTSISDVQARGGYHPNDGRWSHAAMYLGDGDNIVEATFNNLADASVRITSLGEYCDGKHSLRFRRPKRIATDADDGDSASRR